MRPAYAFHYLGYSRPRSCGPVTPSTVVTALARGVVLIGEAISYRINSLEPLRGAAGDQQSVKEFRSTVSSRRDSVDYSFTLNLKDCYPIGVVLGREMKEAWEPAVAFGRERKEYSST